MSFLCGRPQSHKAELSDACKRPLLLLAGASQYTYHRFEIGNLDLLLINFESNCNMIMVLHDYFQLAPTITIIFLPPLFILNNS